MRPPPPPPPPLHPAPPLRATPSVAPKLLRRTWIPHPRQARPSPPPARGDLGEFLDTTPPPPRSGRPVIDEVDFVPSTPLSEPRQASCASYAEVVRRSPPAFMAAGHPHLPRHGRLPGTRRATGGLPGCARGGPPPHRAARAATPPPSRRPRQSPEPGWTHVQSRKARRKENSSHLGRSTAGRQEGHSWPAYPRPWSAVQHSW